MDEQNSQELKIVKRDLEKNGISFNSLTPKAQNLLIKSEEFLQTQKDKFKDSFQAANKLKYDVQSFCESQGLSRAAIYKKNKQGINQYSDVIKYINSRSANYEAFKKQTISEMYSSKDEDAQLLNNLLTHEAEYYFMKEKVEEQNQTIKNLQDELNTLRKLYGTNSNFN